MATRRTALARTAAALGVALVGTALLAAPATAAAGGSPGSFAVQRGTDFSTGAQAVVRWNPCTPIDYTLNPGTLGAAGIAELQRGVGMAARASGLTFRYLGTTRFVPRLRKDGSGSEHEGALQQLAGAPLVIGYATSRETNWFGNAGGMAQLSYRSSSDSPLQVFQAVAFVRSDVRMPAGYGRGGRGGLVLHEIGHALGLEHVTDRHQTMYPVVLATRPSEYHRGDLTGLRTVGRSAGCLPSPPAATAPGALSLASLLGSESHAPAVA